MIYNSFNHTVSCKCKCTSNVDTDEENDGLKNNSNDDVNWESKYNISIEVLKEEYLQSLHRIRNVDEKANKYFLVISILIAGFFVVSSSSAIDSLEFNYLNSIYAFLLTLVFGLTFIISFYYGVVTFKSLLNCFELVETRRMPDLKQLLIKTENENSLQYKDALITRYQDSINAMDKTVTTKQSHIRKVSKKIGLFIIFLFTSLIILILLKLIG